MVSTWTASASDSSRRLRSSSAVSRSASAMRRRSHDVSAVVPSCSAVAAAWSSCATWRTSVSVRSPSAVARTRAARPSPKLIASVRLATPRSRRIARPAVQAAVDGLPLVIAGRRDRGRAPAEERRERRGPGARRRGRALDRLEQPQPVPRRRRGEHAARAVDHRGDAGRLERVADQRGVEVLAHEHRDVPGLDPLDRERRAGRVAALDLRAGRQELDEIGGHVLGDPLARRGVRREPPGRAHDAGLVAVQDAQAQRRRHRRAGQARRAVRAGRPHLAVLDALLPQPGAAEQRVVGVDQPLIAAPVHAQRRPRVGLPRRGEVGVDVGAAERVDRLLGIADQHERAAARPERAPHDVPLDGVGVLELVDEHDAVARAQPARDVLAAWPGQRPLQSREQVVVGHDRAAVLAQVELLADLLRQPAPHRGHGARRLGRGDRRGRVVDDQARDPHRLVELERGRLAAVEAAHVEVVDDLLHEVADVLDQLAAALHVARHAEAAEHLLAEAVRRGDGGRVEVGERALEPRAPLRHRVAGAGGEQGHDLVAGAHGRAGEHVGERLLDVDEALADPLAQLARRHPRERHEQQLAQRRALGDVAGGERRDRVRLARPRARLEHGDAGRERAARVERAAAGRVAHRSVISSHASRPSHSRRA